jgi:hypothetical protein
MAETIRRNGSVVPGFALGESDPQRFMSAFDEVLKVVEELRRSLSPRETLALQIGLAASHLEESIIQGHTTRARAHAENVARLLEELKKV